MLDGQSEQLAKSPEGSLHYHPQPSSDGKWLLYGSKRDGVRQLFVMRLADRAEHRLTNLKPGHAAMWPHWQAVDEAPEQPRVTRKETPNLGTLTQKFVRLSVRLHGGAVLYAFAYDGDKFLSANTGSTPRPVIVLRGEQKPELATSRPAGP